ncbi:MAG TPA: tetratricopeptide repeat protein [Terriglobales bacterium]|nr:tetratricopeptide repeat protein [Terriglobales bacterium]
MNARLDMLKQLVDEHPGEAFPRYGLAVEYANRGDIEAALQQFAKLLEQHPNYTAGYQMSAQTLLRAGRSEEARGVLAEGIASARREGNSKAEGEMQAMLDEMQ